MPDQKIQDCFAIEHLQQLLKQSPEQLTIIDVRNPEEYGEKHIPGSINIPLDGLPSRLIELSKQAMIITVCGKGGGRSAEGAALLQKLGFTKATSLCGGTAGWYDAIKQ